MTNSSRLLGEHSPFPCQLIQFLQQAPGRNGRCRPPHCSRAPRRRESHPWAVPSFPTFPVAAFRKSGSTHRSPMNGGTAPLRRIAGHGVHNGLFRLGGLPVVHGRERQADYAGNEIGGPVGRRVVDLVADARKGPEPAGQIVIIIDGRVLPGHEAHRRNPQAGAVLGLVLDAQGQAVHRMADAREGAVHLVIRLVVEDGELIAVAQARRRQRHGAQPAQGLPARPLRLAGKAGHRQQQNHNERIERQLVRINAITHHKDAGGGQRQQRGHKPPAAPHVPSVL